MSLRSIYKILASLLMAVSLNGCATDSSALSQDEDNQPWLNNANAEADAMAALDKNDFRYMAMSLRGTVIPGIAPENVLQYELRCGVIFMQGISDTVRSKDRLKTMQQAHDYAVKYNTVIKSRCSP